MNKNVIGSLAYKLNFGKYKGSRLDSILYSDPSYIIWLKEKKVLNLTDRIVDKARDVIDTREEDIYDFFFDYNDLY